MRYHSTIFRHLQPRAYQHWRVQLKQKLFFKDLEAELKRTPGNKSANHRALLRFLDLKSEPTSLTGGYTDLNAENSRALLLNL